MKGIIKGLNKLSIMGKICLGVILLIIIMGIFSKVIAVHSYRLPSGKALEAPSVRHFLGTDDLGIDIFAQICFGARISIVVGFCTALLAGIGGSLIGIFSGYYGGIVDKVIMRIVDIIIVIPDLPLMIVLGAFFKPSIKVIIFVLSLVSWTNPARILRSKIIALKQEKYIAAAKSYGAGFAYITVKHFLPNIFPIIMVNIIKLINRAIVAEASLAFIGLGDPTSKSWGLLLNHAISFKGIYFTEYWKWWILSPLTAIALLVASIAFIGRDIEKIMNTKL